MSSLICIIIIICLIFLQYKRINMTENCTIKKAILQQGVYEINIIINRV